MTRRGPCSPDGSYSGLTDAVLKLEDIQTTASLGLGSLQYEELAFSFLPGDAARFKEILEKLKGAKVERFAARFEDFDRVFDAVVATKGAKRIHNGATAIRIMAELAFERLAQIEAEAKAGG